MHGLRGKTSIADRVEWDNYYIENWSLWLDMKILLLTIPGDLPRQDRVERLLAVALQALSPPSDAATPECKARLSGGASAEDDVGDRLHMAVDHIERVHEDGVRAAVGIASAGAERKLTVR